MQCFLAQLLKISIQNSGFTSIQIQDLWPFVKYSEVPNRRADQNKRAGLEESDTLLAYLLSKLLNEQGGIFHFTK